jgi:tetratricopeptide (TPR) repeat protein
MAKLRESIGAAAATEMEKMVKTLADEAEWKTKKGDHEGALELLGSVVRDAADTAFSTQAVERSLPIALAGLAGKDREAILEGFETWVGQIGGGPGDRREARLLVLQQRYRDGDFARARDGLRAFVAEHGRSELAPRARLLLALAIWRAGSAQEAIGLLEKLAGEHPRDAVAPRALFLVGYLRFAGGQPKEASAAFSQVIKDYPDSPFAQKAIEFLGGEAFKRRDATAEEQP